ncbi:thymidine kinase 2, mitochondrial-like [Corticium candelabrum]|uniref:thymidine kinase 2, mitochondrial-like n=1 Tax=Corticium candelabrum TaxID=121492 RepID=UPI002E25BDF3|nr:thymidine kinase 2, mitochondrial-like [Corticium candelabrum]
MLGRFVRYWAGYGARAKQNDADRLRVRKSIQQIQKQTVTTSLFQTSKMVGDPDMELCIDESLLQGCKFKITVEGNIASGKTTLLNCFKDKSYAEVLFEPIDKWQKVGGDNLLGRMYENKERWGLTFQSYVLLTMMELHHKEQHLPISVLERSAFSGRYCFLENLYRSHVLDDLEHSCYTRWFDWLMTTNPPQLDLIVYLQTSPEVCLQRLKERQRGEETGITLDYLQSLHDRHEEWLSNPDNHGWHSNKPVLILDGDKDCRNEACLFEKMCNKIVHKLLYPACFSPRSCPHNSLMNQTPPAGSGFPYKAKRNLRL